MKCLFVTVICLLLTLGNLQALKVYLISNHDNPGDHNQALGIAKVLDKYAPSQIQAFDIDAKNESPDKINEIVEKDLSHEKVVVIGSGEGGVRGISDLPLNANLVIALTSHTFLPGFENPNLLKKVSFIALPIHVSANIKDRLDTKLLEITGVPHNRDAAVANETFKRWKKLLPPNSIYHGVVLGGDAPTPTKEMKLFTKKDAKNLANFFAEHVDQGCVLVLNGPRTGKHDENKSEIANAHKDGQLDYITRYFKECLEAKLGAQRVKVFDFQFNHKSPYNSFDLVAGAIKATNGKLFVPGESSSLVSEAVDILSPGQVIIYNNNAMNEVHQAHIQSEFQANRASLLENYENIKPMKPYQNEIKMSAATIIAKKLWEIANR